MGIARKLAAIEHDIQVLITKQEEIMAITRRRKKKGDDALLNSIEDSILDLKDASINNQIARAFERAGREEK